MPERILRTSEAARYCGLASSTLEKMRSQRQGPAFIRLSANAVGYEIRELDAWITARKRASSSAGDDAE
jgi:predicted DNA-binding transcriptional regulator AlpA